jgi:hypothetical protein
MEAISNRTELDRRPAHGPAYRSAMGARTPRSLRPRLGPRSLPQYCASGMWGPAQWANLEGTVQSSAIQPSSPCGRAVSTSSSRGPTTLSGTKRSRMNGGPRERTAKYWRAVLLAVPPLCLGEIKRLGVFVGQADVAELMVSQEELVAGVWIGWHALGGRLLGCVLPHPAAFNQMFARGPLGQLLHRS